MVEVLASGRTADVIAVDTDTVLRRYRVDIDAAREATVMTHVRSHGFPVPVVHRADRSEIEMERLHGPTMLRSLLDGHLPVGDAARMLADLHHELHAVPPMRAAAPDSCLLHLDLHPDNVVLTASGPVVIDWTNATHGPAALDVAMSALILAQVAVDEATAMAQLARDLLRSLVMCVGGVDAEALERVAVRRRADPMMSRDELDRLSAAAALVGTSGQPKSASRNSPNPNG